MDPLDRLYWRLVETLRRERPGSSWELSIAEIYQHLVPYRSTRAELGFAELPEYEHALLRLLAGERGYVSLDLPQVQEELARELRASNPILGLYRDYAAVGVRLNPAPAPEPTLPDPPPAPPPAPAATTPAPPARRPPSPVPQAPAAPAAVPAAEVRSPPPPRRPSLCRSCRSHLPEDREVRFCPFCGATQRALPCAECGERVEPDWKFCAGCGAAQGRGGERQGLALTPVPPRR